MGTVLLVGLISFYVPWSHGSPSTSFSCSSEVWCCYEIFSVSFASLLVLVLVLALIGSLSFFPSGVADVFGCAGAGAGTSAAGTAGVVVCACGLVLGLLLPGRPGGAVVDVDVDAVAAVVLSAHECGCASAGTDAGGG